MTLGAANQRVWGRVGLFVLATAVVVANILIPSARAYAEDIQWLSPVDAPVVDPFRPPSNQYSAGNRGLEFGLTESSDVRAVDDGRVSFAGRVGSSLFITVDHGNGLVSTLAYLDRIDVVRGQFVSLGQIVGTAGPGFHLTARLNGIYIDPALLIAGAEIGVALVKGPDWPDGAAAPERRVGEAVIQRNSLDWLRGTAAGIAELRPSSILLTAAASVDVWHHQECTDMSSGAPTDADGVPLDLNPDHGGERILIQVGGLGSSSESASIGALDPIGLGYSAEDVKAFSYAGGCTPQPFGLTNDQAEAGTGYGPDDTYQDINLSAERLADLVEQTADGRPGVTIDLAAHSLGGVVTRRAIEILEERGRIDLLGTVVTIGSPHRGADLATIASAAHGGLDLIDLVSDEVAGFRDAESVIQLSEVGLDSIGPVGPPPEGPTVVAVADASDLIVPGTNAVWVGATNVLVTSPNPVSAHSNLPGQDAVRDAIILAQAGAAPACVELAQLLAGASVTSTIGVAENLATVAAGVSSWLL